MADAGLIFTCVGCCCGRPEHGGALAPGRVWRAAMRRAHRARELDGRVRLSFTDCLGPCSEANVLLVYLHGRPWWFRRVNSVAVLNAVLDWTREAAAEPGWALPPVLMPHSFAWTGGGAGREPPITDST
jgi:cobaltochelatase CobN